MRRKQFITNYTIKEMEDLLHSKEDFRIAMRLMTCVLVAKGFSVTELQKIFYYKSAARYFFWARRFNDEGLKGLIDREGRGRKASLMESEYEELKKILLTKSPEEYGFNSKVWNGQVITDLIYKVFGVNYRKANIYIMLKKKLRLINRKSFGVIELKKK
jgi:transposase